MKDFEHGHGDFDGWSQDRADSCISQFAGITKHNIKYGISISLRVDHWRDFIAPNMALPYEEKRGPYVFLLQFSLEKIVSGAIYLPRGEQIATFFEENNFVQSAAKSHYALLKKDCGWNDILLGCSFEPKEKFIPFQAADMLAYERRKSVINNMENRKQRKLILNLRESQLIEFMQLDLKSLIDNAIEMEQTGIKLDT